MVETPSIVWNKITYIKERDHVRANLSKLEPREKAIQHIKYKKQALLKEIYIHYYFYVAFSSLFVNKHEKAILGKENVVRSTNSLVEIYNRW